MNSPNSTNLNRWLLGRDIEERFHILSSWTLRFSLSGPDHLYLPKRISGITTRFESDEIIDYQVICVTAPVRLPLYFRNMYEADFHFREHQGWGDRDTEKFDYPELNLCESCERYWTMIELSL